MNISIRRGAKILDGLTRKRGVERVSPPKRVSSAALGIRANTRMTVTVREALFRIIPHISFRLGNTIHLAFTTGLPVFYFIIRIKFS